MRYKITIIVSCLPFVLKGLKIWIININHRCFRIIDVLLLLLVYSGSHKLKFQLKVHLLLWLVERKEQVRRSWALFWCWRRTQCQAGELAFSWDALRSFLAGLVSW